MNFLHTMIRITNLELSLKFYQEVIGLKFSRQMELSDATLYFLIDERNCCELELTYNHELPKDGYSNGTNFGHLAFETDDMGKFSETLKRHNLEYSHQPFLLNGTGPNIAFITDPDGIIIEIIEKKPA